MPDAMFFTRAVPVTPGATAAEAACQVELALEAVSPFPLAQLYYGWFWVPGAESALVFAAYRRRFTTDQAAAWEGAELVLPSFGALLGAKVEPATTIILNGIDGLTAVYWDAPPVPAKVLFSPLDLEASEEERLGVRDELLRAVGGSKTVLDLPAPPMADSGQNDREVIFRAADFESRLPALAATSLDVRDKGELAALRNARKRDVILWRVALGAAAGLLLLIVGELALFGGHQWQKIRLREVAIQKPLVDRIVGLDDLAQRIEDITTPAKRLLPIEMVIASATAKPEEVRFTRAVADSKELHTLVVEGVTANSGQINVYEAALNAQPSVQSAVARIGQMRPDSTSFSLAVVFKPNALQPMQPLKTGTQ